MKPTDLTDNQILDIMNLASQGKSHSVIATMVIRTRDQVSGIIRRVNADLKKAEAAGLL